MRALLERPTFYPSLIHQAQNSPGAGSYANLAAGAPLRSGHSQGKTFENDPEFFRFPSLIFENWPSDRLDRQKDCAHLLGSLYEWLTVKMDRNAFASKFPLLLDGIEILAAEITRRRWVLMLASGNETFLHGLIRLARPIRYHRGRERVCRACYYSFWKSDAVTYPKETAEPPFRGLISSSKQ